jgi:hypothetical protein
MTPELRQSIVNSRTGDYVNVMRTTMFTLLGIGAALHFGAGEYSAPLMMLAVTATAYGVLAGGVALDDLENLKGDMDEALSATSYGGGVAARNIPMLKMISTALIGLTGLATILAILI